MGSEKILKPTGSESIKTRDTFVLSPEAHQRIEKRIKNLGRAAKSVLAGLVFATAGHAAMAEKAPKKSIDLNVEQTLNIDGKEVTGSFIHRQGSKYIFSTKDGRGWRYDEAKKTFTELKEFKIESKKSQAETKKETSKDLTSTQIPTLNALSKANTDAGVNNEDNVKKINEQLSSLGKGLGEHKDATRVNSLDPSHGSMVKNKTAVKQASPEKKGTFEQNVFNSDEEIKRLIEREGKEKYFYTPSKVGRKSQY